MIKTIISLKDYHFHIPAYQRGYRWTAKEVEDLLNDIKEFKPDEEKGTKYCLQPLIVKKQTDGSYEVVDGQQRLTTIAIFMQIVKEVMPFVTPPFTLDYTTRERSKDFLENIKSSSGSTDAEDNIDFYHMTHAYQTMFEWLNQQPDLSDAVSTLYSKIINKVFFIWYEVPAETRVIDLFNRVNMGKIPLTNAELIKALLLNQQNFNQNTREHDQAEMSIAWERMEHGLGNDAFWYFFNEKVLSSSSRMDQLFRLVAKDFVNNPHKYSDLFQNQSQLQEIVDKVKKLENSSLFSFYLFYEIIQSTVNEKKYSVIKRLWQEIESLDALLHSWYDEPTYYHLVGLLITFGKPLYKLVEMGFGQRKREMLANLLAEIKKQPIVEKFLKDEEITNSNSHKKELRNLLLFFNIATLVTKSEKQARFPFDIYKKYDWDIEHIHATADDTATADDNLGNLTLLDKGTNRSYKNKPFKEKRAMILACDQSGLFIPVCTKNIFIKAYSANPKDLEDWYGDEVEEVNHDDKTNYLLAMKAIVGDFFDKPLGEKIDV